MMIDGRSLTDIMIEILSNVKEIEGGYSRIIVLFLCIGVISFINRKDIGKVCVPIVLSMVLLFTPHLYVYLYQTTSYKRFFWILPDAIIVSYTFILIISRLKKNIVKCLISFVLIVSMVLTGTNIYSEAAGFYRQSENIEQIDQSIVDLSEAIMNIDDEPTCVIPWQAVQMIRVADANVIQVAGRNYFGYMGQIDPLIDRLVTNVSSPYPDSEFVFSLAYSRRIKVVVTMSSSEIDESISSRYGYEKVSQVGDYILFYNPNPGPTANEWYVTQYGPNWGQNYFYTIEDSQGNLIIIDGGHYGNTSLLQRIISDHNDHVSAWIFTTLNIHHIGAAYNILSKYGDLITVDCILIQPYSEYMINTIYSHQADWEIYRLEVAEDFVNLISQMDNVSYVGENQDYEVLGLNVHIYHVWDESVDSIGTREVSNSSLVFSIAGDENSMLFTSYTTAQIENDIFDAIGDEQFDYITVNDHGERVFDYWWYESRHPIGIFIDEDVDQLYLDGRAQPFYSYICDMGYNVYTFETVPNRIVIR